MFTRFVAAGALCVSLIAGTAQAAVVFEFRQVGNDVVGTLSGSLDLPAAQPPVRHTNVFSGIFPSRAYVGLGDGQGTIFAVSGPREFGLGDSVDASSSESPDGQRFGILGDASGVPGEPGWLVITNRYQNGDPLQGTLTFLNKTFASLGVNPGSYVYSVAGTADTVTISFIPLPATLPLMAAGLAGFGLLTRRRHARAAGPAQGDG